MNEFFRWFDSSKYRTAQDQNRNKKRQTDKLLHENRELDVAQAQYNFLGILQLNIQTIQYQDALDELSHFDHDSKDANLLVQTCILSRNSLYPPNGSHWNQHKLGANRQYRI